MSLFESVSGLAVRHLTARHLTRLRETYLVFRRRVYPFMRFTFGTFDTSDLRKHLEERLGQDFEILMVHSSVNNMLPMYDGEALGLVRMLMEFCGPDRTLVMPAFYFGDPAVGGAGATFEKNPYFDLRRTPSQMGLATELFRRSKGVVCSRHPVYRISALGPLAETITRDHEHATTPAGVGTPFEVMTRHDTLILGIGKPFEVLTHVHHPEDVMGDAFPVPRHQATGEPLAMTLVDGKEKIPFRLAAKGGFTWRRNMWKLRGIMNRDSLREWQFHHVPLFATRAAAVTDAIIHGAERGLTIYENPDAPHRKQGSQ